MKNQGFTLIELLIVIGVVATLSTVAILVINPAEFIKQARDSRRLTEMKSLNSALSLAEVNGLAIGSSSVVYVSLPDTSPTCNNLGLPSLPSGWSYSCQTSANYRKVDGNGWVPVNFTQISSGSPLSILPVDPVNSTSTGNYYTYVVGGSWKLTSLFESEKYAKNMNKDGGSDTGIYEVGNNLNLANFARGLVGYWKFDEGSGTAAGDSSGRNNNSTLYNSPAWTSGQVSGALRFDGSTNYVIVLNAASLENITESSFTFAAWVNPADVPPSTYPPGPYTIVAKSGYHTDIAYTSDSQFYLEMWNTTSAYFGAYTNITYQPARWYHVVGTFDSSTNKIYIYVNGENRGSANFTGTPMDYGTNPIYIGTADPYNSTYPFWLKGQIDEVRIYNRALSAAEIQAIYNATK